MDMNGKVFTNERLIMKTELGTAALPRDCKSQGFLLILILFTMLCFIE